MCLLDTKGHVWLLRPVCAYTGSSRRGLLDPNAINLKGKQFRFCVNEAKPRAGCS